jgi:VanZ family protein
MHGWPGERFAAFLVVGILFGTGYPKRLVLMIALVIASAALFELAQHLAPNRHGTLVAFVAKAVGGVLGVLLGALLETGAPAKRSRRRTWTTPRVMKLDASPSSG